MTTGIVLAVFLGVTGVVLEQSFRHSTQESVRERLMAHMNVLIASVEEDEDGRMMIAYALPETRFFTPRSGLYAVIMKNNGDVIWRSPSMQGLHVDLHTGLARGSHRYELLEGSDGLPLLVFSLGLTWGDSVNSGDGYTFFVIEGLSRHHEQIRQFRTSLWGWLAGVSLVLLVMLALVLRWGLQPLRRVADDLVKIEQGQRADLDGVYPRELRGLTDNLNALIHSSLEHEERYKASLGDLAHSLKTPLAVLRGGVQQQGNTEEALREMVDEQVERMDQIVQYQLQRASTTGRRALMAPLNVPELAIKVIKALDKVYAEKGVKGQLKLEAAVEFHGQEGDLMEVLGNLLDNAYKWCRKTVVLRVARTGSAGRERMELVIEDDGPGIAENQVDLVLRRGFRADERTSGHGLGLDMVREIVALYEGELSIGRSVLGGALIRVVLPPK